MKNYMTILFIFFYATIFSQKIDLMCKKNYDSIFSNIYNKSFSKNIKYNKQREYIRIDTLDVNDENYRTSSGIYVNRNNFETLNKLIKKSVFFYSDYYTYNFLYKGISFYETIYSCETVNKKEYINYEKELVLSYYNKIRNKEYINPKLALKIAKRNGLKSVCSQSLTGYSFYSENQTVWEIKECDNDKQQFRILELDPKNGKILNLYKRNYGKTEEAAYWNSPDVQMSRIFNP